MVIAKTASRNVAFKVARMRESIMEDQDELITRKLDYEDVVRVNFDLYTNLFWVHTFFWGSFYTYPTRISRTCAAAIWSLERFTCSTIGSTKELPFILPFKSKSVS